MGMANFRNRSRGLTDMEGFLMFFLGVRVVRLRVGAVLDSPVEGEVSSSGGSWGVSVRQAITLLAQ